MRVFINEIKKLWTWRSILLIMLVFGFFYAIFTGYWSTTITEGGHPHNENYFIFKDLQRQFGERLTPENLPYLEGKLEGYIEQADDIIANDSDAQKLGISTYEEYMQAREEGINDPKLEHLNNKYFVEQAETNDWLMFNIQELEEVILRYKVSMEEATHGEDSWQSIFPYYASENIFNYITYSTIMIMLSLTIILAPLLTRDRLYKVDALQLSSQTGRRIYRIQLFAILTSSFALITALIVISAAILQIKSEVGVFWNNNMASFSRIGMLFPIEFGHYVLLCTFFIYAIGLGLTLLLFAISYRSDNYISLLSKAIPAFAAVGIGAVCLVLFNGLFTVSNPITHNTEMMYMEPLVVGVVVVVGLIVGGLAFRRSQVGGTA